MSFTRYQRFFPLAKIRFRAAQAGGGEPSLPCRARARSGFSLIELLAVISVIAVLGALLFVMLGNVIESARKTTCASNLRQLASGHQAYVADNEGWIITGYKDGEGGESTWTFRLAPYLNMTNKQLRFENELQCPVAYAGFGDNGGFQGKGQGLTYGLNACLGSRGGGTSAPFKMSSIEQPSKLILFGDQGTTASGQNDFVNGWNLSWNSDKNYFVHDNGTTTNVVFLDGHVESLTKEQSIFRANQRCYPWTETPVPGWK